MILRALAILSCAIVLAGPAASQPAPVRMEAPDCTALAEVLVQAGALSHGAVVVDDEGWCDFGARDWRARSFDLAAFQRLRLRGLGLAGAARLEGLPASIEMELDDLIVIPAFAQPYIAYHLYLSQLDHGADIRLRAFWDASARAYVLDAFEVDFSAVDSVQLTVHLAAVEGDGDVIALGDLARARLSAAQLVIRADRLFQTHVLPALVLDLGDVDDPEQALADWRAEVMQIIEAAPLAAESRAALARLIGHSPIPRGELRLNMAPDIQLGALVTLIAEAQYLPILLQSAALLDALAPGITYTPAGQP